MIATVYWNIRRKLFSVRVCGKVIAHATDVYLQGATFHVQACGRERVRSSGRKNVHAYIRGVLMPPCCDGARRARYNPKRDQTFVCDGTTIHHAEVVTCHARLGTALVFC